jgi:secretion/DNA translocation related CpaE-like protein
MTRQITDGRTARGGERPRPLVVTGDEVLLDDLLRLCAAAGAEAEVAFAAPPAPGSWETAPVILLGADSAGLPHRVPDPGVPRPEPGGPPGAGGAVRSHRGSLVVVGRDSEDTAVWRRAVQIGADHVAFLPEAERWLVDRIADATEGGADPALTIAVLGGRGGAGASTLACALAVTAARSGHRTVLVDGDPLGGGLDVLLGAEQVTGLRWPDLADSRGRVSGTALDDALPGVHGLSVLSWDRGEPVTLPPQAMCSVLAAARRRGGLVVLDLPRRMDDTVAEALAQTDVGLLVVPAELRAVAAAARVAARATAILPDLRAVVRGPAAPGLDDAEIARLIDLPLAGELPPEPALAPQHADGAPPGSDPRGPLARFSAAFLTGALSDRGSVTA